ncbi:MAG: caib/baif family protein [Ilumatobacteraceae bacterium]|nr:caib/baif family protein [Ilumatobacteraceae bacterium]
MGAAIQPADADIGVPTGTADLALTWAAIAAARAEQLTGVAHTVDVERVLAHVLLPLLVGDEAASTAPRAAPGGGFVHTDLIFDDEPLFAAITADHPDAGAEALAALMQECRLPVTPYRTMAATDAPVPPAGCLATGRTSVARRVVPGDITIVDLTAMWAGPLCTMLLAEWGAEVVTIEPAARPDGLRNSPRLFAALDRGKHRLDLDLRDAEDRIRFEQLIESADVVIESFSPRVMANFGYSPDELRRRNARLVTLSLRAFPSSGPQRGWVGYGRGVHATSGLGLLGAVPQPVRFAYPDPIAGLVACATVFELLGSKHNPSAVEVSLAGAIAPLLAGGERPLASGDPPTVERLRAAVGVDPGSPLRPAWQAAASPTSHRPTEDSSAG